MHNITLVCTRHEEWGNCNPNQLLNIIEEIQPEIIFEELSESNFDKSYNRGTLSTLETDAIKMYLENHEVKHIPVDTYPLTASYYDDVERMYEKVANSYIISESHILRELRMNQKISIFLNGFTYLNSNQNDKFFEEFNILKEKILNIMNDENLFRIHRLEMEMIEKREYEMVNNIYEYSQENSYNQALFFIGSGHRKAIFSLIEKHKIQEELKLNWILNNFKLN